MTKANIYYLGTRGGYRISVRGELYLFRKKRLIFVAFFALGFLSLKGTVKEK